MKPVQWPDSFDAADYAGVVRRRWPIVLALTIIGLIAAFAYVQVAPKSYTGTAALNILPTGLDQANGAQNSRVSSASVNLDTEAQVVTSTMIAAAAAHIMHSSISPVTLSQNVSVTVPPNSSILNVSCVASTAAGSATCANAVATAYLQHRSSTASAALLGQEHTLANTVASLQKTAGQLTSKIGSLPASSPQRAAAQTDLTAVQNQINSLNAQQSTLTEEAANDTGGSVISPAAPPGKPTSPTKTLVLPSGAVAGLVVGLIAAFMLDRRDKRIHSADDVPRLLGLPVMLNVARKAASQQLSLASPTTRTGRAYTEFAHAIAASLGEGSHVVFVAGTTPGAGGSVIAANLAATLARTHSDVVLVCADLDHSAAPGILGVEPGRGLAEVLAGRATVTDVAREPTAVPGLWVITPGEDTSLAVYNLQHDRAQALISQLRADARFVVIEARATEDGADTFGLAEFADGAVVTIEIPRTTETAADECIGRLRQLRTKVLGAAVLSAASPRASIRPPRLDQQPGAGQDESQRTATAAGRGQRAGAPGELT